MKCSRCGYKAKDIGAMGKHCRKHHPSVFKKKGKLKSLKMSKREWTMAGKANGWL